MLLIRCSGCFGSLHIYLVFKLLHLLCAYFHVLHFTFKYQIVNRFFQVGAVQYRLTKKLIHQHLNQPGTFHYRFFPCCGFYLHKIKSTQRQSYKKFVVGMDLYELHYLQFIFPYKFFRIFCPAFCTSAYSSFRLTCFYKSCFN